MPGRLDGKIACITGAGSGLGRAIAERFAAEGATIVAQDLRVESADDHVRFELHESLTGHHHHLVCTTCGRVEDFDVPDDFEAGIDVMVHAAESQGFRIDAHRFDLLGCCARCSSASGD